LEIVAAEAVERLGAQRLIEIAVERRCVVAVAFQRERDDIDVCFTVAKDDAVLHFAAGVDRGAERGAAGARVVARQRDVALRDGAGGGGGLGGFDALGV